MQDPNANQGHPDMITEVPAELVGTTVPAAPAHPDIVTEVPAAPSLEPKPVIETIGAIATEGKLDEGVVEVAERPKSKPLSEMSEEYQATERKYRIHPDTPMGGNYRVNHY